MADLTAEHAAEIVNACKANAGGIGESLGQILDTKVEVTAGESTEFSADSLPEGFDGPGLAIVLRFGEAGMLAALPAATGLVPDWCQEPDLTGESRLSTLGQELSLQLVPEDLIADEFHAAYVDSLSDAVGRAAPIDVARIAGLQLSAGDSNGQLSVVWPLTRPGDLLPTVETPAEEETSAAEAPASPSSGPAASAEPPSANPGEIDFDRLPPYTRSLLRVRLPVHVQLAGCKESVQNIVEMAPGSILKFEKACDDLLQLYVGEQLVAEGEAVKVGDKFGFRVNSITLPDERFNSVGG